MLAEVQDDIEGFYLRILQPVKLGGYLDYFKSRTWKQDVKVILLTAVGVIRPSSIPPPTMAEIGREASALATEFSTAERNETCG